MLGACELKQTLNRYAGILMNVHQPPPALPKPVVSPGRGSLLDTMRNMWPYIWPSDRADLKMRVVIATALLVIAKVATLAVPFAFKWAVDGLTENKASRSTCRGRPGRWLRQLS